MSSFLLATSLHSSLSSPHLSLLPFSFPLSSLFTYGAVIFHTLYLSLSLSLQLPHAHAHAHAHAHREYEFLSQLMTFGLNFSSSKCKCLCKLLKKRLLHWLRICQLKYYKKERCVFLNNVKEMNALFDVLK